MSTTKSSNSNAEKYNECNPRDDSYCIFEKKIGDIRTFIDSEEFDDLCSEFGEFDFTKPLEKLKEKLKEKIRV